MTDELPRLIAIHDLVNPDDPQGRTYKQINAAKQHAIPIGTLVEIDFPKARNRGVRLFVVHHGRDCDLTPLYELSADPDDTTVERPGFRNRSWMGGYPEYSLKVITEPKSRERGAEADG